MIFLISLLLFYIFYSTVLYCTVLNFIQFYPILFYLLYFYLILSYHSYYLGLDWVPSPSVSSRSNSLRIIPSETLKTPHFRKDETVSKHVGFTDLSFKDSNSRNSSSSSAPSSSSSSQKLSQAQRLKELTDTNIQNESTYSSNQNYRNPKNLSRSDPNSTSTSASTSFSSAYSSSPSPLNKSILTPPLLTSINEGNSRNNNKNVKGDKDGSRTAHHNATQIPNTRMGGGVLRRELEHMMDLSAKNVVVALRCYAVGAPVISNSTIISTVATTSTSNSTSTATSTASDASTATATNVNANTSSNVNTTASKSYNSIITESDSNSLKGTKLEAVIGRDPPVASCLSAVEEVLIDVKMEREGEMRKNSSNDDKGNLDSVPFSVFTSASVQSFVPTSVPVPVPVPVPAFVPVPVSSTISTQAPALPVQRILVSTDDLVLSFGRSGRRRRRVLGRSVSYYINLLISLVESCPSI